MYLYIYLRAGLLPLLASRRVEVLPQGLLGVEGNFTFPTEPPHIFNIKANMLMVSNIILTIFFLFSLLPRLRMVIIDQKEPKQNHCPFQILSGAHLWATSPPWLLLSLTISVTCYISFYCQSLYATYGSRSSHSLVTFVQTHLLHLKEVREDKKKLLEPGHPPPSPHLMSKRRSN